MILHGSGITQTVTIKIQNEIWKHPNIRGEEGRVRTVKATVAVRGNPQIIKNHLHDHVNPWATATIWYWKHTKINDHYTKLRTKSSAALDVV